MNLTRNDNFVKNMNQFIDKEYKKPDKRTTNVTKMHKDDVVNELLKDVANLGRTETQV